MDVREQLERELRAIYDDDEFVLCVIGQAKSEENHRTILSFIEKAREEGDEATYEDMVGLSLILRERLDNEGHEKAKAGEVA